jgi:hypothetical protein
MLGSVAAAPRGPCLQPRPPWPWPAVLLISRLECPAQVGDWLLFPSMGAYTLCGASKFNGIDATAPPTFYVCSQQP